MKVKSSDQTRLRIGELADHTGVATHRLRHYEECGLLTSDRDTNGYRSFAPQDVVTVGRIVTLLHAGLNLEEIAEVMPHIEDADADSGARIGRPGLTALRARSVLLEAQIECIATAKRALERILGEGGRLRPLEDYDPCGSGRDPGFNLGGVGR